MSERVETIVIGAGQAGLAMSYCLQQQGCEHLVLEAGDVAGSAWRDDRWDSFALLTPNWTIQLPGAAYQGPDPGGFLPRDEIFAYLGRYAADHHMPVRYGVRVQAVAPGENGRGYRLETAEGRRYQADNVIVATGLYQKARIPAFSVELPTGITQLSSGRYRSPEGLPPGAVLVVGSAQSGCQIAEELYQAGRTVYLCTSRAWRMPRRYRGKDIFEWLVLVGFMDRSPDKLPSPAARFGPNPHVASGKSGSRAINLHQLACDGVRLLGHIRDARNGKILLAPDLPESLAAADAGEKTIVHLIDNYIAGHALAAPAEELLQLRDGYAADTVEELDCAAAGITSVIWAMGYVFDFSLVKLPVFDEYGYPVQHEGATRYEGLYFAGLPWLTKRKSGLFLGVGEDTERIAQSIAGRATR